MEYRKVPLTISQQMALLVERGLTIDDEAIARRYLERIGYYRMMGYLYVSRVEGSDRFAGGATFDHAIRLYEFDHKLRCLVLEAICHIEVSVRTAVTFEMAHAYGAFGHYDARSFAMDSVRHEAWVRGVDGEVVRAREAFLDHFRATYVGYPRVPVWMATEVMSFGSVSRMVRNMHAIDQKKVARRLGQPSPVIVSWLHAVAVVRNVCAHHGRVWNRVLGVKPMRPRTESWQRLPATIPNDQMFFLLAVLHALLAETTADTDSWVNRVNTILSTMFKDPGIRTAAGAPAGWEDHPIWQTSSLG